MNLYQYKPPSSAHPPKMMKGIVYGLIRQYKLQNTLPSDYINQLKLLFQRFVARGWDKRLIKSYILEADSKLSNPTPSNNNADAATHQRNKEEQRRRTTKKNNEEIPHILFFSFAHYSDFRFRFQIPTKSEITSLPQIFDRYVMLDEERSKYGHYLQKLLLCNNIAPTYFGKQSSKPYYS
ncbi:hypothetical protein QTG54_002610 [Skeletonema marinoi]|uniref:Uncharacterized protein n=1 Tax=Skeletonema marinoi TaxID=267567 RepID=A0AAD9DGU5_9STRA|nr:hypothetical protein QTG54_002610 [Skeletonema marinoi]